MVAAGSALAQGPSSRGTRAASSDDQRARLSRGYERAVHDALTRYFADNTFLVRATVDLDEDDDASGRASSGTVANLPGLPYQPFDLRIPGSPDEKLQAVELDVLVDTAYTQRDRDFIQYLATVAANLDTSRGDEIRVGRAVFPRDDRSFRKPDASAEALSAGREAESDRDTVVRADSSKSLREEFLERLIWVLPLVVVCLFMLVGLWLVRRPAVRRIPEAMKARIWKPRRDDDDPPSQGPIDEAPPSRSRAKAAPSVPAPAPDGADLRPFLVNAFVGEPRICGQILRSWIDRDVTKGLSDTGLLLSGGNARLLDLVRDVLGKDASHALEARLAVHDEVKESDFLVAAKEFRREYQNATLHGSDTRDGDLFGFLEQLNEAQILHILKDEPLGISGFALAQVSPTKAGSILQKLDAPTRARLMYAIGNVTQIPRDVYKEVADRLSLKAMEVANMKFVAADGVESLVQLIDKLPIDQQFQYIHALSEVDLNLAKKVREKTITFPELAALPDRFLAAQIQAVEPETLALILPKLDKEQRARFLSLLPERMRLLLDSAMETRRNATPADVESAQNRLLRSVREEIRRNGRPS